MPLLIRGPTQQGTPSQYTLSPREAMVIESVTATFDGTGAAGAFLPVISIYAQSGELLARSPATSVAAGSSAEVTFAPLLRPATSASTGGSGWQYNIDNTGGWGLLETVGNPNVATSQASSFTFGDAPSSYSLAVNSDDGTVFTNNPGTFSHVVTIEAGGNGTDGGTALFVQTDATAGGNNTVGVQGDINGGSGNTSGINLGVGASTGLTQGVSVQVDQNSGAATAATYGVNALATSNGSGDTFGVRCMGHALGGGLACALVCVDHTGAKIFEVRDDGSVHIKLGTAVIADL